MKEAYIYDAVRTPRGKGKSDGSLHEITPVQLGAQVLDALKERNQLNGTDLDDVIYGCVMPVGEQGANIARASVLQSSLGQSVAGLHVNRFCASGLEAVNLAAAKIVCGESDLMIAGGVESMSRVPMGADGGAAIVDPDIVYQHSVVPQGISADLIASLYNISREDADTYSVESHKRAYAAQQSGFFDESIIPVKDILGSIVLSKDETIRPNADLRSLSKLAPAFQSLGEKMPGYDKLALQKYPQLEKINHVHTAANSSGVVDGASGVLIGTKEMGLRLGLRPRAKIKAMASIGSEPTIMLTGPEFVTKKVLDKAGMNKKDIDLWELNEAFASVVLRYMQTMDIDHTQINVNGGAIAMGHPLGATGAMILGTMLDEMERADKGNALITLCVGMGMGTATIIERIN